MPAAVREILVKRWRMPKDSPWSGVVRPASLALTVSVRVLKAMAAAQAASGVGAVFPDTNVWKEDVSRTISYHSIGPQIELIQTLCSSGVSISTVTRSITTSQETSTSRSPTPTTSSESSSQTETTTRTTTSSQEQSPPMRPTTDVESTVTATETITGPDMCPTGFYACSAVYQGGCCRTGRDCDTTSCPPTSSVTVVDSNGVTVAVPTGDAATTSNPCATGWFSCAASDGGGCCPSGFACGRESCTASGSGTATSTVAKMEQDAAAHMRVYPLSLTLVLITVVYLL